jgi:DNA replicative helicase MCM subunit Mcm2 (Cdc46/Mcm family)
MKGLKSDLQFMVKTLKALSKKTERIAKRLDKLEKAKPAKKLKTKSATKAKAPKKASQGDTVLAILKRSKKGVDRATLIKKSGFEGRRMRDILYKLKKQGKIRVEGKGVYLKA